MTSSSLRLRLFATRLFGPRVAARLSGPPDAVRSSAGAHAVREYFAYHGIWAPGVRALRKLSVHAKVLLLMAILCGPLLPLAWAVISDQMSQVALNAKRAAGVELAATVVEMQMTFSASAAAADAQRPPPADQRQAVDQRLTERYAVAVAVGLPVQLAWERGRAPVELALRLPASNAAETRAAYPQAVMALRELREVAVVSSGIFLTEDQTLQKQARLALEELISVHVALTELRQVLAAWEAPSDQLTLQLKTAAVVANLRSSTGRAEKLLGGPGPSSRSLAEVKLLVGAVNQQLLVAAPAPALADLLTRHAAARVEVDDIRLDALTVVKERLAASTALAERHRLWVVSALLIAMALAMYLGYCFFLVLRGGLKQLNHQMLRMAEGDMSSRAMPLGEDEVAQAMRTMSTALVRLSDLLASVGSGVGAVKQASEQVAAGNKDMRGRNLATADGVAAVLDGMTNSVQQLTACGKQVEKVVGLVQALRLESARNRKQMHRLRERMSALRVKSHEIGEIVTLIDNIAFRTNILALNASVEASKAGEAGRGFAVVATEVRNLALRGADAARRIGDIVVRSKEDIESSGVLAEETGRALAQADAHVDQIHAAMEDVAGLTSSGETANAQIVGQLTLIKADTAQGLNLVSQLASASDALRSQGERLAHKLAQFKLS